MAKICILLLVVLSFLSTPGYALSKIMTIKLDGVQLYSGPGTQYHSTCEYDKGFPLEILSTQGKWVKVEDFENDSGWISKESLTETTAVIVKANKEGQDKVNIHAGPGVTYGTVGKALYGVVFQRIGQENGWTKVHHDSGLTGWIKSSFLWGTK